MPRTILEIMEEIILLLEKEGELSIRQIAIKTRSQRITVRKSLDFLKRVKFVKERKGTKTKRDERLFSLVK